VEVPEGEGSAKRTEGKATIDHLDDEGGPKHFLKVLFQPTIGMMPTPREFMPYFAEVPWKIILRTYNEYKWTITMRIIDGKAVLDQAGQLFPFPMISGLVFFIKSIY
jgi:hypothetical protein